MMRCTGLVAIAASALLACQQEPETVDATGLELEARGIAGEFVSTLQPTLQEAMQSGGPVNAIDVCAVEAPRIAGNLSQESGWDVTRVSLQPRNRQNAEPDAWEREMLMQFDERQAAGEAGADINVAAIVDDEFRYMQAQAAMPLCLTCHGQTLAPEVTAALAEHYPDDMATGYVAGEIRGAISLRRTP